MGRAHIVAGVIIALLAAWGAGCGRERPITVGSKNFTEQVILGEIVAQHLEHRLDVADPRHVAHHDLLGGEHRGGQDRQGAVLVAGGCDGAAERHAAVDASDVVVADKPGAVTAVSADAVTVANDDGTTSTYRLAKFRRSNQGTSYNQRVLATEGEHVDAGAVWPALLVSILNRTGWPTLTLISVV